DKLGSYDQILIASSVGLILAGFLMLSLPKYQKTETEAA
ncbi:MAG: hypothetical protein RL145_1369, partial [Pseudomonadota bacterium]